MPVIAVAVAAVFSAVGGAVAAGAAVIGAGLGAIGLGGIAAGLASFGTELTFGAGMAAGFSAWTTVIGLGATIAGLFMTAPKPQSAGQQITHKLDPQAPVPIVFGRTGTGGYFVYRGSFGQSGSKSSRVYNSQYGSITVLSAGGPIEGIENFYMSNYQCNVQVAANSFHNIAGNGKPYGHGFGTVRAPLYPNPGGGSKLFVGGYTTTAWKLGTLPESSFSTQTGRPIPLLTAQSGMSGLASAYVELGYSASAFPSGEPQMLWTLRGVKCYDPRKDSSYPGGFGGHRLSDSSTWEWSENPFICALAWCLGRRENGFRVMGIGANINLIDIPAFINGANVADENGWVCGGSVVSTDDKVSVLNAILQAGGGQMISKGARISCCYNAPKVSIDTITSEDVVGQIVMRNTTAFRDRKNSIVPMYREEASFWNQVAGEMVTSETYRLQDSNELRVLEVQYTMVQNAIQCAQLAGYDLANLREGLNFSMTCHPRLLNRHPGDCVTIDIPDISDEPLTCVIIGREFDPSKYVVNLTLRSETPGKNEFALGQSPEAPNPIALPIYDPSNPDVPQPGSWGVVATSIADGNGVTVPAISIAGAVDDPNAASIIAEVAPAGSNAYTLAGEFPYTTTSFNITSGIMGGVGYSPAISYRTFKGVVSDRLVLDPVTPGSYTFTLNSVVDANGNTLANTLSDTSNTVTNNSNSILTLQAQVAALMANA
jgi:hypothetical protein